MKREDENLFREMAKLETYIDRVGLIEWAEKELLRTE
jgi:hypothetical protein